MSRKKFARVRVAENGRVVIPAEARRVVGIEPGGILLLRYDAGGIHIMTYTAAVRSVQKLFSEDEASGDDAVDELLTEAVGEGSGTHDE